VLQTLHSVVGGWARLGATARRKAITHVVRRDEDKQKKWETLRQGAIMSEIRDGRLLPSLSS